MYDYDADDADDADDDITVNQVAASGRVAIFYKFLGIPMTDGHKILRYSGFERYAFSWSFCKLTEIIEREYEVRIRIDSRCCCL